MPQIYLPELRLPVKLPLEKEPLRSVRLCRRGLSPEAFVGAIATGIHLDQKCSLVRI